MGTAGHYLKGESVEIGIWQRIWRLTLGPIVATLLPVSSSLYLLLPRPLVSPRILMTWRENLK
jgi:hypothetical protein